MTKEQEQVKDKAIAEAEKARQLYVGLVAAYPIATSPTGSQSDPTKHALAVKEHYTMLANMSFSATRVFSEVAKERVIKAIKEAEVAEAVQSTE